MGDVVAEIVAERAAQEDDSLQDEGGQPGENAGRGLASVGRPFDAQAGEHAR